MLLVIFLTTVIPHMAAAQPGPYPGILLFRIFNNGKIADPNIHGCKANPAIDDKLFKSISYTYPGHYHVKPRPSPSVHVKKNIFVKKINGYDIEYDLYYPSQDPQNGVDSIVLYAKRGKSRTMLLSVPIGENYLDEVSIKYFLNHPFLYIMSGDSHGDVYGELNSFSLSPVRLELVNELPLRFPAKVPKGYYQNKNYGIRIEENDRIFDGKIYRNDTTGDLGYIIDVEYKMLKTGNSYKLKPIKQTVMNSK